MKTQSGKVRNMGLVLALTVFLSAVGNATASYAAPLEPLSTLGLGVIDLLRAHSERVVINFGENVRFERYEVVNMLGQYFVATGDVKSSVRYTLHDDGQAKTLVIE